MMTRTRQLMLLATLLVAMVPYGTSAESSITRQSGSNCNAASLTATRELPVLSATETRQLAALRSADQRLQSLVQQATVQGHNLPTLSTDEVNLAARITRLVAAYNDLTTALKAASTGCTSADLAPATTALATVRAQVASAKDWYTTTLAPDLAEAAK